MEPEKQTQNSYLPKVLGLLLVLVTGFGAIAAGIYVSHSADPFWALFPVIAIAILVWFARLRKWTPTVIGGAVALCGLLIIAAILFLGTPAPLLIYAAPFIIVFILIVLFS